MFEIYPTHWPKHYNSNEPCDMIYGPCCCGATHSLGEEWVQDYIKEYGINQNEEEIWRRYTPCTVIEVLDKLEEIQKIDPNNTEQLKEAQSWLTNNVNKFIDIIVFLLRQANSLRSGRNLHDKCHDGLCSGSMDKPRGEYGCSCRYREMTVYHSRSRPVAELVTMSKIAADYLKRNADSREVSEFVLELNKAIEGVMFYGEKEIKDSEAKSKVDQEE